MLDDTAAYYSCKPSNWILKNSCPKYMLKFEECLKKERERVSHYLHSSTEEKLVEKVQNELLVVHANQLLGKESSGCLALFRDHKVENLLRMFRFYHKIPQLKAWNQWLMYSDNISLLKFNRSKMQQIIRLQVRVDEFL